MKFRILSAALVCAAFVCATSASAGYITSNGDFALGRGNALPPTVNVASLGFNQNGQLWTNQITGAPFQNGGTVRTVGATTLNSFQPGNVALPTNPPKNVAVLFAVQGTITGLGQALFTGGSLFFIDADFNSFDVQDPDTWNFSTMAGLLGKFDLLPQAAIVNGFPGNNPAGNFSAPANQVNLSRVNGLAANGDGIFVFSEDTTFKPNFLSNVDNGREFEGVAINTSQNIDTPPVPALAPGLTGSQLGVLDDVFQAALAADFSGMGFEFNPYAVTGDFSARLGATGYVITANVPEPSSIAMFAFMVGGAGLGLARRRRKA